MYTYNNENKQTQKKKRNGPVSNKANTTSSKINDINKKVIDNL